MRGGNRNRRGRTFDKDIIKRQLEGEPVITEKQRRKSMTEATKDKKAEEKKPLTDEQKAEARKLEAQRRAKLKSTIEITIRDFCKEQTHIKGLAEIFPWQELTARMMLRYSIFHKSAKDKPKITDRERKIVKKDAQNFILDFCAKLRHPKNIEKKFPAAELSSLIFSKYEITYADLDEEDGD